MRLLSWNILHGGGGRRQAIAAAIGALAADVAILQEVRAWDGRGPDPLLEGLADGGLTEQVSSPVVGRANGILIASRWPFRATPLAQGPGQPVHMLQAELPWPREEPHGVDGEEGKGDSLKVVALHFPQKEAQVPLFEALLALPNPWRLEPSVLIGDFNCGIPFADSDTRTFACTHLFQALLQQGWVDGWRVRNGQAREFTWISPRSGHGFRYDHALLSPALNRQLVEVRYLHQLREGGLSDHSGLWLELA
ncbi:MAG: endonuclease/exonuclease/phosphatase family protein [Cyanobacteriota bacterium]|nr:endonuclease/exonuclease/phosphatase family protein [Cyanobacteriota bacterium]